jgi:acetylornithine deacetylase/succinyl-diaminopimelate desuccinylase family protein
MSEPLEDRLIERIGDAVEDLRDELVEALAAAVAVPSVNPMFPGEDRDALLGEEGRVARMIGAHYERAGAELDVFGLVPGRENAVGVVRGAGGGRSLIFNGHIDVVPPGPPEHWRHGDPWSGRVEDGFVWGRGTTDMKGGVVAQAFAAIALRSAGVGLRGDLLLEAVVGEESMQHELGTTACVERGYRADGAVVSEPSAPPVALAIAPVTAGNLCFAVHIEGRATHASMRGETISAGGYGSAIGVCAIDKMFLIHRALSELEREWGLTKTHPLYRPGHFSLAPCVMAGGPSSSSALGFIPDTARIEYEAYYPPDQSDQSVRQEIEECVAAAARADAWLREHAPRVEWLSHWPASVLAVDHPLVEATRVAHAASSGSPAALTGHVAVLDSTWLNRAGIPAINYGPGDLRVAHAVDERVAVEELVTAARTYALLAAGWCGVV